MIMCKNCNSAGASGTLQTAQQLISPVPANPVTEPTRAPDVYLGLEYKGHTLIDDIQEALKENPLLWVLVGLILTKAMK